MKISRECFDVFIISKYEIVLGSMLESDQFRLLQNALGGIYSEEK